VAGTQHFNQTGGLSQDRASAKSHSDNSTGGKLAKGVGLVTPPPHNIKTPSDTVNADGSQGTGEEKQRGKKQELGVKKGNQEH